MRNKIADHFSFLVMLLGSGFLFISSIYLFGVLGSTEYVVFSMFIVFASLVSSFGALGAEQALLRLSKLENNTIYLSNSILFIVAVGCLVGCISLAIVAKNSILSMLDFFIIFVFAIISTTQMLVYNVLRLSKKYTISQVVNNLTKLCVPLLVLCVIYEKTVNVLLWYFFITAIFSVLIGVGFLKKIDFKFEESSGFRNEALMSASFFYSMFVILLINYIDKLYVSRTMSHDLVASYMLMQNIFLSPLLILSSYFGFKGLVKYKSFFDLSAYGARLRRIIYLCLLIDFLVLVFLFVFRERFDEALGFKDSVYTIYLLISLGLIRVVYSDLSAAMGAIGVSRQIFKANSYSLFMLISLGFVFYYVEVYEINVFLLMLFVLWVFRSCFYYNSLRFSK